MIAHEPYLAHRYVWIGLCLCFFFKFLKLIFNIFKLIFKKSQLSVFFKKISEVTLANPLRRLVSGTKSKGLLKFSGHSLPLSHRPVWVPGTAGVSETWFTNLAQAEASNLRVRKTRQFFLSSALTLYTQQRKEWPQYKHLLFKVESFNVLQKQTCMRTHAEDFKVSGTGGVWA